MAVMRHGVIIKTDLQLVHLAAGYAREHAWAANLLPGPEQAKYLNSKGRCNITPGKSWCGSLLDFTRECSATCQF